MYKKITRAFTIVELIICIAMIAIFVSIALPYFHEYRIQTGSQKYSNQIICKLIAMHAARLLCFTRIL